jgi:glycosyltransferase involved in cell wall biosynthesis
MNICHVFYSLNYGGIETLIVNISDWQILNNIKVDLVLINSQDNHDLMESLNREVNIIEINRKEGTRNFIDLVKINFFLFKNNYDVIHVHSASITTFLFPLLKSKTLLHVHETLNLYQIRRARYNRCVCISNAVKLVLVQYKVIKNISTIYSGVDFESFEQRSTNVLFNKIVCVGRLDNAVKNLCYVIDEFNEVKGKTNANLYIIGEGKDYDLLDNYISLLNLNERVFLLGGKSQDWLKNNLCKHDLFIQASKTEGLGVAPIEAAAASLPMILSSIEGHLEVTENGKFGELFDPYLKSDLAKKISNFYCNSGFYFELAIKSRDDLKRKFDFQLFNKRIIETYVEIVG